MKHRNGWRDERVIMTPDCSTPGAVLTRCGVLRHGKLETELVTSAANEDSIWDVVVRSEGLEVI
jgi:hypothetical protein